MRPVRVLSLYLAFVFLGGALIAPWVYGLVQTASGVLPTLHSVASKPFPRYVNRSLLILALAGLLPFLRAARLKSWRELGLSRRADAFNQLGWGFLVGLITLACVVFIALAAGAREPSHDHGAMSLLGNFSKAALTAALVATLEELIFRGALFGALRKTFHWTMALVLSSAVYALVHFLERPDWINRVGWSSGFVVLGGMVSGFGDLGKLVPGFLSLTLAGMILGLAYQRSGSLHFSIGLHAGWIFWLKTYGFITTDTANGRPWFFGSGKLIDGWLAFILLAFCFALLSRLMVPNDPQFGWKERKLLS